MVKELRWVCDLSSSCYRWENCTQKQDPEEEWEWAVEGIKEVYAYTRRQMGLKIGIEPINTDLRLTS